MRTPIRILTVTALLLALLSDIVQAAPPHQDLLPEEVAALVADLQERPPDFYEDFEEDSGKWIQATIPIQVTEEYAFGIEGGAFQMSHTFNIPIVWTTTDEAVPELLSGDYYVQVTVELQPGSPNVAGIVHRFSDVDDLSVVIIEPDWEKQQWGGFAADLFYGNLANYAELGNVLNEGDPYQPYTVGVLSRAAFEYFLINGDVVGMRDRTSGQPSTVGLISQLARGTVAFDDLQLWQLNNPTDSADSPATPDAAPIPSAEIAATLAAIHDTDPLFSEEFRRDTGEWQPLQGNASVAIEDRMLKVTAPGTNIPEQGDLTEIVNDELMELNLADFLLEIDTEFIASPGEGTFSYGVNFRSTGPENRYWFIINPLGAFRFGRVVDGKSEPIIEWQVSEAIATGEEINRLGVLAQGEQLTFLINDQVVDQVVDSTHTNGTISLFVFTGEDLEFAFDNLDIWELPPTETEVTEAEATEAANPEPEPPEGETITPEPESAVSGAGNSPESGETTEDTLIQLLENGEAGLFHIIQPCEFHSVHRQRSTSIAVGPADPNPAVRDEVDTEEEAARFITGVLEGLHFRVDGGQVQVELLGENSLREVEVASSEEGIKVSFETESATTGSQSQTRFAAVVEGNQMRGSYFYVWASATTQSVSGTIIGTTSESTSRSAEFTCAVTFVPIEQAPPITPQNFRGVALADRSVQLTWTPQEGVDKYQIYASYLTLNVTVYPPPLILIAEVEGDVAEYTVDRLATSVLTASYYLRAINAEGQASKDASINVPLPMVRFYP